MPELGKKKVKEAPKQKVSEQQIVSAYSEEGQSRIASDNRRKRKTIIIWISIYLVLLAAVALIIYFFMR